MRLIWEISFLLNHDRQHDSATCIKNLTNIYILGHFDGQREHRIGRQGPTPVPSIYFTPSLRDVWKGKLPTIFSSGTEQRTVILKFSAPHPELSFLLGASLGMLQGEMLTYLSLSTLWTIYLVSLCHWLIVFCFPTFYVCRNSGYSLADAAGKWEQREGYG